MLTVTSTYALRALTCLAAVPDGKTLHGRDIAKAADIPPNYLSKILWTLGSAGLLDATRGTAGGYRLKRPAAEIRLIEIVDLFDKITFRPTCVFGGGKMCSDGDSCTAHHAWRAVGDAYRRFLETTTLAEISHGPRPDPGKENA